MLVHIDMIDNTQLL